jgi:hypothetical protein
MGQIRNVALTVIGFGFTAAGIFMMLDADTPDDRVVGGACALFFGGCGLLGASDLVPSPPLQVDLDGKIRIWTSRVMAGIFCLAGLGFMAVGALMAQEVLSGTVTVKLVIGALAVPFGLLAVIVFARDLIRPRLMYVIDRTGIESLHRKRWRLGWDEILRIDVAQMRGTRWLMLVADNGLPPYSMLTSGSRIGFEALYDTVMQMWNESKARRRPA